MRADRKPTEEFDFVYEWDEEKAEGNLRKHRVDFQEATTVFWDTLSLMIADSAHSQGEERYLLVGVSATERLLVVAYTERGSNIRIISCRRATRSERQTYEEQG